MNKFSRNFGLYASLALLLSCGGSSKNGKNSAGDASANSQGGLGAENQIAPPVSERQKMLASLTPTKSLAPSDSQKELESKIENHFKQRGSHRYYLHLDKPLYRPGESIWFRIWEMGSNSFKQESVGHGIQVELISPKGSVVLQKRVRMLDVGGSNDFVLPDSVQGGEYILRVRSDLGGHSERKFIVSQYQPPRIKKKAEFLRKAYGAGDKVAAAVSLERATGEALANKKVTAIVQVDSAEVARFPVTTDKAGHLIVRFDLPTNISVGDGLLTLLIEDGGVTESLQKRIPIIVSTLGFAMYPEGGDLVEGLPGRVYFSAKNTLGKAADVEGIVVDRAGNTVSKFRSFHNGNGRFEFTPKAGELYTAKILKPAGIKSTFTLPNARTEGCTMQALDDYQGTNENLRMGVWCSSDQELIATAMLREKRIGSSSIAVAAGKPSLVSIAVPPGSQGAVRFTLFDESMTPRNERLVYRGLGDDLKIEVKADRKSYSPRDQVELSVVATDLRGAPVEADFSLAVVDDTVLSFADDKSAHLLSRVYLESEMPGQIIEEPNFYFSEEAKAAAAIDMVLGTQGWRRFEWQNILASPVTGHARTKIAATIANMKVIDEDDQAPPRAMAPRDGAKQQRKAAPMARPERPIEAEMGMAEILAPEPVQVFPAGALNKEVDKDWAGHKAKRRVADKAEKRMVQQAPAWAAVRVFPTPNYKERYDGPRTDFRETIHWAPSVKTDASGKARLSFYTNDAITSFRVTTEGISKGGLPGRSTSVIKNKLPISLAVKMPLEVSKGDTFQLPVTLANETDRSYEVKVASQFGAAFMVSGGVPAQLKLKAGERKSFFAELKVQGDGKLAGDGLIRIAIDAANLKDEVKREVRVMPLGFPQEISLAGTVQKKESHRIDLSGALPGSIEASITLYPSPLATMIKGTEGMIREPSGCFEQASSANYPNIMVLSYLEENAAANPVLVEKTMGMLDRGYKKLVGYESPKKGFEWFGGDPGHEALTAYGLLEFSDMSKVYGDVNRGMITRTQNWLRSRRNGKGGYKRNKRALDSFGGANEEVTNGYITYALSESGDKDLSKELRYQQKIAQSTKDPYVLSLAVNTLANFDRQSAVAKSAMKKLLTMQSKEGGFTGAAQSITRSGGKALHIETTSLALLAMLKFGNDYTTQSRLAVSWLNDQRDGYGNYSSTQATVLALKSLAAYTKASRQTQNSGTATIYINGQSAGSLSFEKGHKEALVFDDIATSLKPGKNTIEVRLDSKTALPYSIAIDYRSDAPASSPDTVVTLSTKLAKDKVPMGEGVRMNVELTNATDQGQPMTLARVGLPGGLTFQTWQLKELVDKQVIDFYETREREVVLYFRSLAPGVVKKVDLDLIARIPGQFVAPASSAYLYYTDEYKFWNAPMKMEITK